MTCIVGLADGGRVWIGGDSAAFAGCERFPRGPLEQKVFNRGEMLFGYTGPTRFGQILEHALDIPTQPQDLSEFPFLIKYLMVRLRMAIIEHDGVKINDSSDGWEFLLGYHSGLYLVSHDLSVTPLSDYGAVGCGNMIALGSLYSSSRLDAPMDAQRRVRLALEAAAKHDMHVAPPFVVESID